MTLAAAIAIMARSSSIIRLPTARIERPSVVTELLDAERAGHEH